MLAIRPYREFQHTSDYDDPEFMLRSSTGLRFSNADTGPPKTHDATARDAYYGKVADKFWSKSSYPAG